MTLPDAATLAKDITNADRTALARAITLIESKRDDHQAEAQQLLKALLPHTGKGLRIGITGVPGVGKSTFIEAFGLHLIEQGHKVAVLAIDPSSSRTGGSIMGDKTRMPELSRSNAAFIRPSPTTGALGGVARRTREAMLACEAAGYDICIVETVGVGQSEIEVSEMVDVFLLLLLPGSGDELQGIKKGIVELADILVVNKADGDMAGQARRVQSDYASAVRILSSEHAAWQPKVLAASALEKRGLDDIWETAQEYQRKMQSAGLFEKKRKQQAVHWMWKEIRESLLKKFSESAQVKEMLETLERDVADKHTTPYDAAQQLLKLFLNK